MNFVVLGGRLGKDGSMRTFESGKQQYENTLAMKRGSGDKATTDWITIKAWDKTAELLGEHFPKKGAYLQFRGDIQQETWEKDGQKNSRIIANVREIIWTPTGSRELSEEEKEAVANEEVPF